MLQKCLFKKERITFIPLFRVYHPFKLFLLFNQMWNKYLQHMRILWKFCPGSLHLLTSHLEHRLWIDSLIHSFNSLISLVHSLIRQFRLWIDMSSTLWLRKLLFHHLLSIGIRMLNRSPCWCSNWNSARNKNEKLINSYIVLKYNI